MRMIPNRIDSHSSRAEKDIFTQLSELEVDGWQYALHSLNLPEHERKRVCEIDFLLLGPRGLLVLEAKGGAISRRKGIWHTQDLRGTRHRLKESPLEQASSSMFALEKALGRNIGSALVGRAVFGYGTVFPDCDFNAVSVEWRPEMVIDAARLRTEGWATCLDRLATLWEGKSSGRGRLSAAEVEDFISALRPDFDRVLSLRRLDDLIEMDLVALTTRQYRALDLHRRNPRLIFEGGAGTGKTMLAVEICRRARSSGDRALLTCRSDILASFIRAQPDLDGITVAAFDRVSAFDADAFDLVVVDEAQDIVNEQDLAVVDSALRGGLTDGRWSFLLDSNNQRGLVGRYEETAMAMLQAQRPAVVDLMDNCRNTTEIVTATRDRTGADLGVTTAGRGREVVVIEVDRLDAAVAVATVLAELEEHDVPLEQVVLLSPHDLAKSVFVDLPDPWRRRVDVLDLMRMRKPSRGHIGFARIADFKGLESRYVILETHGDSNEQTTRAQLYVGMTRAKAALWIVKPTARETGR